MSATVKTALFAVITNILLLIGLVGIWKWWDAPKRVIGIQINSIPNANTADVLNYHASVENKSFWLRDYTFHWHVYDANNGEINYQPGNEPNNSHIILGAGNSPTTFTITAECFGLNNWLWLHPKLVELPKATTKTVIAGGNPQPNPNPNPSPTQTVWALAIFDTTGNLTATQSAIFNSTTINSSLDKVGANWHVYYINDTIPTSKGNGPVSSSRWGKAAISVGLPALVIINSQGSVLSSTALPNSESAIVQMVQSVNR